MKSWIITLRCFIVVHGISFITPVRSHFVVIFHMQPSNSCYAPFCIIAAREWLMIVDTSAQKIFSADFFLVSELVFAAASAVITGSTGIYSNSRLWIPRNSSRPKKKTITVSSTCRTAALIYKKRRHFDENVLWHSQIIHSPQLSAPKIT